MGYGIWVLIRSEDSEYMGIEKDAINRLPLYTYNGTVELIRNVADAERAVEVLKSERVLGFDTETRPAFKKGVGYPPALVQLAGKDVVYIFQIGLMGTLMPLVELFKDASVLKTGVAIHDDLVKLKGLETFFEAGFLEITKITEEVGIANKGLRGLTAYLLGVRVSKGMQVSNWGQDTLSEAQIRYAATDAWVSRKIYIKLEREYDIDSLKIKF